MEAKAPWPENLSPENLPHGRLIPEESRHMTLAFLGDVDIESLMENLESFPKPFFDLGFTAVLDQCLFFPERHPRVVAWGVNFGNRQNEIRGFYHSLLGWMKEYGYSVEEREYKPHITVCRGKFDPKSWKKNFSPLPVTITNIHLFESLGHSTYRSLWEYPLFAPFEEIEHTADIAFKVRGRSTVEIYNHALTALAFDQPEILSFSEKKETPASLSEVILKLNHVISDLDAAQGAHFKAVSYHGDLEEKNQCLEWEMIVDV